jgi:hypothetical protein
MLFSRAQPAAADLRRLAGRVATFIRIDHTVPY